VLGITDKDISSTKGVHADWGVMGLGFCPGSACVISSFRVKNKRTCIK
jgi:archaemetzincin